MEPDAVDHPWRGLPPEVAHVLRPELPPLADEIIAAVFEGVPEYRRPLEGPFGRGLRVGVQEALAQLATVRHGGTLEVRYRADDGVREELAALAAAERQCCAFVSWEVHAEDGALVLRVAAPADRPEDVAPLAQLFVTT